MSLFEAVRSRDVAKVRALLEEGAAVDEAGPGGRTPLIEAAAAGDVALVELLLEAGAEPSLQDGERESAILKAAAHGHREVVAALSPHATPDELDTARAFLATQAYPDGLPPREEAGEEPKKGRWLASLGARASAFFGDEDPARRLERLERAEKKKR